MSDPYYAGQRFNLLRDRDVPETSVSNIELFFDLVYVFAVTQLSHLLLSDLTWRGALNALVMLLAVWWVWIDTSWITNWFDPQKFPIKVMLMVLMLLGLLMSAAIPEAFGSRGLLFALAFAIAQLGRTGFCVIALGNNPQRINFIRILSWYALSAVFWLAGGFADGDARLYLWIVAASIDTIAPALGFWVPVLGKSATTEWTIAGEHLAERCQLFIIICLGESILLTGASLAQNETSAAAFFAFLAAFLISVLMWWVYFSHTDRASEIVRASEDPGAYGRAYTYFHMPMVAGIITLAVANELVISHPKGHVDTATALVTLGGAAIYLVGNGLFNATFTRSIPRRQAVAVLALALIAPFAHLVTALVLMLLVLAVFIGLAVWDFLETSPRDSAGADSAVRIGTG